MVSPVNLLLWNCFFRQGRVPVLGFASSLLGLMGLPQMNKARDLSQTLSATIRPHRQPESQTVQSGQPVAGLIPLRPLCLLALTADRPN